MGEIRQLVYCMYEPRINYWISVFSDSISLEDTLLNKCKYCTEIRLAPVLSICLCSCSNTKSQKMNKQFLNPQTDEDKWSHGALFWLFSLCQFGDSTVDSRRTCYCAVTICHFCTVIVSFCSNASELIRADSSRTLTQKEASAGGEMENLSLFVTPPPPFFFCRGHFIGTHQIWVVTEL